MDADAPHPWTETVNSIVRSAVTLMFGLSVCYGFLFAKVGNLTLVSSDAFSTIAMAVILWWFKDRGDKEKAKETASILAAVAPPTPPATTVVIPPPEPAPPPASAPAPPTPAPPPAPSPVATPPPTRMTP